MKIQLQLKDLFLGKIDAKNELITNSPDEKKHFIDAFLIPENIDIGNFLSGII